MLEYIVVVGTLLCTLAILEIIANKSHIPATVLRKIVHVAMAALVIVFALQYKHTIFIGLGFAFALLMVLFHYLKPLKSISDRHAHSFGEVFFPIGVALAAMITYSTTDFIIAIAILGLVDTMAYFVGKNFRSKKILFNKTAAGSVAFVTVTFLLLMITVPPHIAIGFSIVLGLVELFSPYGSDNLTIPLASAFLLAYV